MFIPGQIVKKFFSKKGKEMIIRYPKWEDLEELTLYINKLSSEDTFITFSGEEIKKEEEAKALSKWFCEIEMGDKVVLDCFYKEKLVGLANIDRDKSNRKRSLHVGTFGISVEKEFRGEGIGYELGKTIIEEAKKRIAGLKMIILDVYSLNINAQNLYKKLGFQKAGCLPKSILYRGQYIDEIKMYLEI
jgi:RimJ/RimL family protein N-acetyltransferase